MQTYSFSFEDGSGLIDLNVPGKYFALIACNSPVDIRFYRQGKKLDLGDIKNVLSGLECTLGEMSDTEPAFDRVQIQTSAADTVTFGISNGSSRYNRGYSTVHVENVSGPFSQAVLAFADLEAREVLHASVERRYVLIQNRHATSSIFVNVSGDVATSANGVVIMPGGSFEIAGYVPNGAVSIYAETQNDAVVMVAG